MVFHGSPGCPSQGSTGSNAVCENVSGIGEMFDPFLQFFTLFVSLLYDTPTIHGQPFQGMNVFHGRLKGFLAIPATLTADKEDGSVFDVIGAHWIFSLIFSIPSRTLEWNLSIPSELRM